MMAAWTVLAAAAVSGCAFDVTGAGNGGADSGIDTPRADADAGGDDAGTPSPPTGAAMVSVPAATYDMGCAVASLVSCDPDELPPHAVAISAFSIDVTEVTQTDYDLCVRAGVCRPPACGYEPDGLADHPVVCVTWHQASAYCGWLGKRLPSEAEWELAARGTDGRVFPWGNQFDVDCTRANGDGCRDHTLPVASLPAGHSPYGALDMAGNAFEWVGDFYDGAYYALSIGAVDPTGPGIGNERVARGGSFAWSAHHYRATNRSRDRPNDTFEDLGFRCAR